MQSLTITPVVKDGVKEFMVKNSHEGYSQTYATAAQAAEALQELSRQVWYWPNTPSKQS